MECQPRRVKVRFMNNPVTGKIFFKGPSLGKTRGIRWTSLPATWYFPYFFTRKLIQKSSEFSIYEYNSVVWDAALRCSRNMAWLLLVLPSRYTVGLWFLCTGEYASFPLHPIHQNSEGNERSQYHTHVLNKPAFIAQQSLQEPLLSDLLLKYKWKLFSLQ